MIAVTASRRKPRQAFPRLTIQETKFFLFASDLPADALAPFVRDLDAMYARLADVFGVSKEVNISSHSAR